MAMWDRRAGRIWSRRASLLSSCSVHRCRRRPCAAPCFCVCNYALTGLHAEHELPSDCGSVSAAPLTQPTAWQRISYRSAASIAWSTSVSRRAQRFTATLAQMLCSRCCSHTCACKCAANNLLLLQSSPFHSWQCCAGACSGGAVPRRVLPDHAAPARRAHVYTRQLGRCAHMQRRGRRHQHQRGCAHARHAHELRGHVRLLRHRQSRVPRSATWQPAPSAPALYVPVLTARSRGTGGQRRHQQGGS